jgi:hypothetical protein
MGDFVNSFFTVALTGFIAVGYCRPLRTGIDYERVDC